MLELGDLSQSMHFELGTHAAHSSIERLYIIGNFSKHVFDGAVAMGFDKNRIFINEDINDPETTAKQIQKNSHSETILFKASRKVRLERITDILKKAQK